MAISPTPKPISRPARRAAAALVALVAAFGFTTLGLGATASSSVVIDYASYVGAKPGKADPKLKPVVIGLVNLQGGAVQIGPLWTPAVETAVKYANNELRGADGHPIVLKKCFIKNAPEEGTKCGQAMANDKRV